MNFVIPKTKEEACKILASRRFYDQPMFKYDMFLIGLVYCSDEEFNYRINEFAEFIDGCPCICKYVSSDCCYNVDCIVAAQETFAMKWDDKLGD